MLLICYFVYGDASPHVGSLMLFGSYLVRASLQGSVFVFVLAPHSPSKIHLLKQVYVNLTAQRPAVLCCSDNLLGCVVWNVVGRDGSPVIYVSAACRPQETGSFDRLVSCSPALTESAPATARSWFHECLAEYLALLPRLKGDRFPDLGAAG